MPEFVSSWILANILVVDGNKWKENFEFKIQKNKCPVTKERCSNLAWKHKKSKKQKPFPVARVDLVGNKFLTFGFVWCWIVRLKTDWQIFFQISDRSEYLHGWVTLVTLSTSHEVCPPDNISTGPDTGYLMIFGHYVFQSWRWQISLQTLWI